MDGNNILALIRYLLGLIDNFDTPQLIDGFYPKDPFFESRLTKILVLSQVKNLPVGYSCFDDFSPALLLKHIKGIFIFFTHDVWKLLKEIN